MLVCLPFLISFVTGFKIEGNFRLWNKGGYVSEDQTPKPNEDYKTIKFVKDPKEATLLKFVVQGGNVFKITMASERNHSLSIATPIIEGNEAYFTTANDNSRRTSYLTQNIDGNEDLVTFQRIESGKPENLWLAAQDGCKLIKTSNNDESDKSKMFCIEPIEREGYCEERYGDKSKEINPTSGSIIIIK